MMLRAALLAFALGAGSVGLAQTPGERLWTLDIRTVNIGGYSTTPQPHVAPDGTIYLATDSLYAISPAGEILWKAAGQMSAVDVGPDGTIYTSAEQTVFAYNPDGTERWRYRDTGGWGVTTGPTVGPDGNVYAVFIQGGLGVASFTPDGVLRWNVPGFLTDSGIGYGRVAFGPDNLYYADEDLRLVAGCDTAPYEGLVSISLDGELEWCRSITGTEDPPNGVVATLDGRALLIRRYVADAGVYAYTPGGSVDWMRPSPGHNVGVGPDNYLYGWSGTALVSLTSDGGQRWAVTPPINNFPWRPEVAPDGSAVVAGSVYGFEENGTIIAADPANGHTLWSVPVTGPSAGVGGPAAFSPDGAVVYVPVNTLSFNEPDQLWAIRVGARLTAGGAPPEAEALALAAAPNPARGDATVRLTLAEAGPCTVAAFDVLGRRVATLHDGPLAAGPHTFGVAGLAPGVYTLRAVAEGRVAVARLTVQQ